jgi:SAM-dependent methyltransferase
VQLKRTLSKRHSGLRNRTKYLIDRLIDIRSPAKNTNVLCIGCRNTAEIDYFKSKGLQSVTGIDLYSESPDILVMDMHCMTFPDNHFGVVYSSHSLEHAYDVEKVVSEIIRVAQPGALVAIEVPTNFEIKGADRVDFVNSGNLHNYFGDALGDILWLEEQHPHSLTNDEGNSIIRTIFKVHKP